MDLRRILSDLRLAAAGVASIGRYCVSRDDLSLAISSFSTETGIASAGIPSRYSVILANGAPRDRWGVLRVDIFLKDDPTDPRGHFSVFEKVVFVPSRQSLRIDVTYDWKEQAVFEIEDVAVEPDRLWRGPCDALDAYYLVKAVVFADRSAPADEVTLVQRLIS